ncbi:MAG: ABC transporter substrate-binding protein [Oscillospiraceae bacterium]|nr:ABC transporter substrate-binding protein [Oscillospiraceae bacterium]
MKKIIAVIILVCIAFSVFASCAKSDDGKSGNNIPDNNDLNNNVNDDDNSSPDNAGNNPETPAENLFDPELPDADYDGYEFRILNIDQESMWWAIVNVDVEAEDTAEVVNDAMYKRNRNIEAKYNFNINEIQMNRSSLSNAVKKSVGAGTDDYDIALPYTQDIPGIVQNNLLVDLHKVPNLDFSKPWWTNDVSHYFSIGNKMVFAMSDLILTDNDDVVITMYNKNLAQDLGLDSADALYNLVEEGKWTFDKFTELTRAASADLTGSGKVEPKEDRFGLVCVNWLYAAMLGGFNEFLVSKNEEDLPYLSCKSERFLTVYQAMAEFMGHRDWVVREGDDAIGDNGRTEIVFINDRALMCVQVLSCCRLYKDMGSDFGILPMPKLDEFQEKYCSYMCGSTCITIPKTNTDLDRTGLILEALSAESRRLVIPAYYDVALGAKYLRDEGSYKMLDIILANRVYELCDIYGWGGLSSAVSALAKKADMNLASVIDKNEDKTMAAIQKTVDAYDEVE